MSREEWRQLLEEVARDPEAASGPKVRALELLGREMGYIERVRRPWWRLWREEES